MQYHVVCTSPGLHRGGRANSAHASYVAGDHTPDQLRDLLAEPHTHVIIGEVMTDAHVAEIEARLAAEPEKPARKGR